MFAGAVTVGVKRSSVQLDQEQFDDSPYPPFTVARITERALPAQRLETPPPPPSQAKKMKNADAVLLQHETDETKTLSNTQLQRFLFLKQLQLINLKINRICPEPPPQSEPDLDGFEID
jgi:hypothetical protein